MNLNEFITATLVDIQCGVHDAITELKSRNSAGAVNPIWSSHETPNSRHIEKVQFDIAVTVADTTAGGGKAGISVVGIELGGSGTASKQNSHVSRIQFSIPIIPPTTIITD